MYCSDVPAMVTLNYKAMYLNVTEDLEESIISIQKSLLDVSIKDYCVIFSLCNVWGIVIVIKAVMCNYR